MTRTRRLISGVGVGYAYQLVTTLVGIWLTAFLLSQLGQERYGLWLLVVQIVGFLGLLDLGITVILPREIAFTTGREGVSGGGGGRGGRNITGLMGQTANHVLLQIPIVLIASAALLLLLPQDWVSVRWPLAAVMLVYILMFPLRIFQATLHGLQDFAALGVISAASWTMGTIVTVGLVLNNFGLYAVALGWSVTQSLTAALTYIRIKKTFPETLPRRIPRLDVAYLRARIARYLWISAQQISHVLLSGTDLLIVGKVLGPATVVPYFCTAKIISVLRHQPQLLMDTAAPALSEVRTGESRERLIRASTSLTLAALIFSGYLACFTLVVNQGFVQWWVGSERFAGGTLTFLLVVNAVLRHLARGLQYGNFAYGEDKFIAVVTLSDGLVTVGAGFALVHLMGMPGVILGSIISAVVIAIPANVARFAKRSEAGLKGTLLPLVPWAWRFLLVLSVAAAAALWWKPVGLAQLVGAAVAITAVYLLVMTPVALREPVGTYFRPRAERVIGSLRRALGI